MAVDAIADLKESVEHKPSHAAPRRAF
jgi:hypothetical protein